MKVRRNLHKGGKIDLTSLRIYSQDLGSNATNVLSCNYLCLKRNSCTVYHVSMLTFGNLH